MAHRLSTDFGPAKPACPWCGSSASVVYESRGADGHAYHRRRRCRDCGKTWPTREALDRDKFDKQARRAGVALADLGLAE